MVESRGSERWQSCEWQLRHGDKKRKELIVVVLLWLISPPVGWMDGWMPMDQGDTD